MNSEQSEKSFNHWRISVLYTRIILLVWFVASFGCSILFRDWCDANLPHIGKVPFGFWMSQQGSILVFVGLLALYTVLMSRLDSTLED